jgi:hypothetical protein
MKLFGIAIGLFALSILIYFGLGWIIKDIALSIFTDETCTMKDLLKIELIVYTCIAMLYGFFTMNAAENEFVQGLILMSPLCSYFLIYDLLPYSVGSMLLFSVINIVAMNIGNLCIVIDIEKQKE